jgi:hypothetical protein
MGSMSPPAAAEVYIKLFWIIYFIFSTGTAFSRASALLFYARVFSVSRSRFRYALWLVHSMNVIWILATLFNLILMCHPTLPVWRKLVDGSCSDNLGQQWVRGGLSSLIIDIIILVMPIPQLWKLKMQTKRRVQISGVFFCGYM